MHVMFVFLVHYCTLGSWVIPILNLDLISPHLNPWSFIHSCPIKSLDAEGTWPSQLSLVDVA